MLPICQLYNRLYDKPDSIKVIIKDGSETNLNVVSNFEIIKGFRAKRSGKIIKLPLKMTADLAYFLGVIVGDGYVKMLKRKKGGYYWEIVVTGVKDYIEYLVKLVKSLFNYSPYVTKEKRRNNSYILRISSMIIFRYLTRIFGFHSGEKSGNIPKIKFVYDNSFSFKNYLAGLIDTDGYVGKYAALIQKDRKFLDYIRMKSKKLLNFYFSKTSVNRRIGGHAVGWWIFTTDLKGFNNLIPLRYK
jgi:hypothetical protein